MSDQPTGMPGNQSPLPAVTGGRFTIGRSLSEALKLTFAGRGSIALGILLFGVACGLANGLLTDGSDTGLGSIITLVLYLFYGVIGWALAPALVEIRRRQMSGDHGSAIDVVKEVGINPLGGFIAYLVTTLTAIVIYLPTILVAVLAFLIGGLSVFGGTFTMLILTVVFIANFVWAMGVILVGSISVLENRHFAIRRSMTLMTGYKLKAFVAFILYFIIVVLLSVGLGLLSGVLFVFAGDMIGSALEDGIGLLSAFAFTALLIVMYRLIVEEREGGDQADVAEVFS